MEQLGKIIGNMVKIIYTVVILFIAQIGFGQNSIVAGAGASCPAGGSCSNVKITFNTQTTDYTLVLSDSSKEVLMNDASANTLTVPLNSSVAFTIGTQIPIFQYGAGQTTISAAVGVTIRSAGARYNLYEQYSEATLKKVGTDEWLLIGDLNF